MEQLLLHLIGDYLLQNDWMASQKKQKSINGLIACLCHCIVYSIPFLLIGSFYAFSIIFISHFLIDRYYFIKYFMKKMKQEEFAKPPFAPWSIIIIDNTFHLLCNYLSLYFL